MALYEKLAFVLVARLLGRNTILNFRNAFDLWYRKWNSINRTAVVLLCRVSTVVLCQYEGLADFLIDERIVQADRVAVLPNGIDVTEFDAPEHPAEGGVVEILFIGSVGRRKGVDVLLDAVAELRKMDVPRFRVNVCGPPERNGTEDSFDVAAETLGVASYLKFHGPIVGEAKRRMLLKGDIFVLPSRAEGFPNSLLEAMLAGMPAVVTDVGAMPEVVIQAVTGDVVPPGNSAVLAASLARLVRSEAERRQLGLAGRDRVRAMYALPAVLAGFADLYVSTAGRR